MNNHFILWIITLFVSVVFISTFPMPSSSAQIDIASTTEQGIISSNETFASSLDLFVVPEPVGEYGIYEERESSSFAPGEDNAQTNMSDVTETNMTETVTNMTTNDNLTAGTEDINATNGSISGGITVSDSGCAKPCR